MKNSIKKMIAVLMAITIFASLGISAFAENEVYERRILGDCVSTVYENGVWEITGKGIYDGDLTDYPCDYESYADYISSSLYFNNSKGIETIIVGNGIEAIGESSFADTQGLKKVVLPEGLKSIGDSAFNECHYLEEINIPDSVEYIGENAFYFAGEFAETMTINIPENLKETGYQAFMGSGLCGDIHFPERFCVLGDNTYLGCEVEKIYLPHSIQKIGGWADQAQTVFYCGTKEEFSNVDVSDENSFDENNLIFLHEAPETIEIEIVPTCTETGLTKEITCPECGKVIVPEETMAALGHTDSDNDGVCDECGVRVREMTFVERIREFFNRLIMILKNLFK